MVVMVCSGNNGIESAQIIRKIRADLPILLCSGFMDTKTSKEASDAGVTRLITKPILAKTLAQMICEMQDSSIDHSA